MKTSRPIFSKRLLHLKTLTHAPAAPRTYPNEEAPLRSELFSADQLEQHGKTLAASHTLTSKNASNPLLARLSENEDVLVGVCNLLTEAVATQRRITPAGEWLLDNFYLIEEQIRTAKQHLPKAYSRELPRLAHGTAAGMPRVYAIALEAVAHGDGRIDKAGFSRFVAAYQTVAPLNLGELWAIPIMLRLALIENLRRVAVRIAAGRIERNQADAWVDRMIEIAQTDPKSLILLTADMARSDPPMTTPFVSEFARRMQGQGTALALPLTWIEQRLAESNLTIEQLIQSGNQQQATDQVSISNSIGSLRFLGAADWPTFVEAMSVVEQMLRTDPVGAYAGMDFATRDRYRHQIEKIARRCAQAEADVARQAIQLAAAAASQDAAARAAHVGYYLIDAGCTELEASVAMRPALLAPLHHFGRRFPLPLYLGAIVLIAVLLTGGLTLIAYASGLPTWLLVVIDIAALLSASQMAVALVNWLATLLATPHPLPKMDFSKGIPADFQTLVIVPTLLSSQRNIEDLLEALEVRFLANRDNALQFGLLTDFQDAPQETQPEDAVLLELAQTGIEALNRKYAGALGNDAFFLFHRPRRWNPQEKCWMGYERKRGKLAELNSLLRGGAMDGFMLLVGEIALLSDVRYVITLDTDTGLPRDTARQLVGAMAHPLNRPHYDEQLQRISSGYGIMQPRVSPNLASANRSHYARLHSGEAGIDPYTRAVSDVYQDVFHEGSFIGKGIYDVDAFERALGGRFPENKILSHDLLEGCYARSGLLSDVQLYEDYPARYRADMDRRHRWIRGDWQLLEWLLPKVPGFGPRRQKNPLSWLSQWKLFDNLRRSLVPAALTLLLLLGWSLGTPAWLWTLAVIAILLVPPLGAATLAIFRKPSDVMLGHHLRDGGRVIIGHLLQALFTLAWLPYETYRSLDAILRTLWRMVISHQHRLEWIPSGDPACAGRTDLASHYRQMWIAPTLAALTLVYLSLASPAGLLVASPILLLWLASPALAWWVSSPLARRPSGLSSEQTHFLRKITRKTWAFFETFVGPEDHWLPPDNYQEYRGAVVAHRTSPTNIGMALLSNLTAYDFGYLPAGLLIERTRHTLHTLQGMERHRGHFYNWYDTLTLQPLRPMYVSTVDSGNLAGHLLTLSPGLRALADERIIGTRWFDGLHDTHAIIQDAAHGATAPVLSRLQANIEAACAAQPDTLADFHSWLTRLVADALAVEAHFADALPQTGSLAVATQQHARTGVYAEAQEEGEIAIVTKAANPDHATAVVSETTFENDAAWWASTLVRQCQALLDELNALAPWLALPDAPDGLDALPEISSILTLRELTQLNTHAAPGIAQRLHAASTNAQRDWLEALRHSLAQASQRALERIAAGEQLATQAGAFANMDYEFLYDKSRRLLAIGYNVDELRRDASYYDLLASEARLSSFVAIAQGQLPQESWFALGRLLTSAGGEAALLSWSGSMFEYLMPLLVMPSFDNTLIDQTCKAAVARQIDYGKQRGVPWGMSESGYNMVDVHLNYQYRVFGVPGLALKRGLAADLVVAPYASVLALMVVPEAACVNLQRLAADGLEGKFGFYEAIDYTAARQRRGESSVIIRSFMAHHQGMSLLSLSYLLLNRPMQRRFASDPLFQATMLLLQERIPRQTPYYTHSSQLADIPSTAKELALPMRVVSAPDTPTPEVQLLSNGRYHVMVTHTGAGYSRWKDLAVTRWREDSTRDNWGSYCYLRDIENGEVWSVAHQPTLKSAQKYEAIFSEGRAEFRRRDQGIDTHTEIVVSPEDDIELRRVSLTNRSRVRRTVELTSYAEVVLATAAADAAHPAFSNLFVQTEILAERNAILCTRRARSHDEAVPWMLHLMKIHGGVSGAVSYETDRMRFIGRCNSVVNPQALDSGMATPAQVADLSGSCGSVLDPIVAIRCRVTLEPNQSATVDIVTGVGDSREIALSLIDKYQDRRLAYRAFDLAWSHSQVVLRQINASEADAQLYSRLANTVIYAHAMLRASPSVLVRNHRGQSGLWGYAISGDLPIVLVQIADVANIELVRQLIQAHAYWRLKGLTVDLVIWNEDRASYRQLLQDQIMGLVAAGIEGHAMDRPGGIFVRSADQISEEDRVLFQSVARVIVSDSRGALADQLNRIMVRESFVPRHVPTRTYLPQTVPSTLPAHDLILFNGLGGFTPDGKEYVIITTPAQVTPAPWVNVLANPYFGTVISENGMAYTWGENAHEFRLTPWHNDPVSDASGEAFYLRDEESGYFWSPTPLPARGTGTYISRHGFGYSVFETIEDGIYSELTVYVALDASVKFSVLKLHNRSGHVRQLSATGYAEWVLGDLRAKSVMHITTDMSRINGALYARNPYNTEFPERVAFFDVDTDAASLTLTGDRVEFIGRNGTLAEPAALLRTNLSGKVGAGLDPCAAVQLQFELGVGETREIVFKLGLGRNTDDANALVARFRGASAARAAREAVYQHWNHTLGAVQIETPDKALDVLTNGWLVYQTIACRLWARTGYYQSGGAFGFRDQLQDVMALIHTQPQLMREQLLLCGSHQFPEGDVQHWWHPPLGRGVRTHCSDDYLWLPLVASRYVLGTGDTGVLDEPLRFLEGRLVPQGEDSYYDLPGQSADVASLYQHCVRAIQHGLRFGDRGLPLMGSGDWNDGMNLVGLQGQGQSVWLGFFLCEVLKQFAKIAHLHNDPDFAALCDAAASKLSHNIEENAWDGAWYRRAYFDDGTPLGSASNSECQIDSISQSWAVLSGAGDATRSRSAMDAVYQRLVRPDAGLIQLLDPPFDKGEVDPGYIRGYVPGVRENGGQYTHSAVWTAMAFAALGDGKRAWTLANMINPLNHARDAAGVATYKVEPYVVTADVYSVSPHVGRGGWSWYTGSAGWMYRLIVESLLGLRLTVNTLHFAPCLPAEWTTFKMRYRYHATEYHIEVTQIHDVTGETSVTLDGVVQPTPAVPLLDDHLEHTVAVSIYVTSNSTNVPS